MAINRTGKQKDLLPEGDYEGRLVYVADLGIQKREKDWGEGVRPPIQQLSLGIEVLGQTYTFEGDTKPMLMWSPPFNILRTLTEMGNELKRFKVFSSSAKEGQVADWDSVLGKPCSIQVSHKNGYANITDILPIPEKYQKDVPKGKIKGGCTGDVDDEDNPAQKAMYGIPRHAVDNNRVIKVEASPDFS
jgi:hypothetical protein